MPSEKILAYAAHWDGEICDYCGEECVWDDMEEVLICDCRATKPMSVWLGSTPNKPPNSGRTER